MQENLRKPMASVLDVGRSLRAFRYCCCLSLADKHAMGHVLNSLSIMPDLKHSLTFAVRLQR